MKVRSRRSQDRHSPSDTKLLPTQGVLDALFEYRIQSDRSRFSFIRDSNGSACASSRSCVPPPRRRARVRIRRRRSRDRAARPRWHQAALPFVKMGFHHILDGIDHLLFLSAW